MGFSRGQIIAACIVLIAAFAGTGIMVAKSGVFSRAGQGVKLIEPGEKTEGESFEVEVEPDEPETLCVHVTGKVRSPGLYELPRDSRVNDAIKAAGGALAGADLETINLAQKLSDGQQVYIAGKGQVSPPSVSGVSGASSPASSENPGMPTFDKTESTTPQKLRTPGQGKVNINSAGLSELQRLPGVGPATAQKILDYRNQHGRFNSVDELEEVSGIGPAKLAQMRPFVTL